MFDGLFMSPTTLPLLSNAKSRSLSAENYDGAKNGGALATEGTGARCASELGRGWKVSPSHCIHGGETFTLANIEGSGAIQSIWMSGYVGRDVIIRMYWDEQENPSVECPMCDFFASAWSSNSKDIFDPNFMQLNSAMIAVNPNRGLNCFWLMPFRKRARITLENRAAEDRTIYYQVNYTLTDVPEEAAYFHAQFRSATPLKQGEDYVILDGVKGKGHYVGTALHVGLNGTGKWWGEGEVKFFMDGDENPTICGTGTEDYFLGAYDWDVGGEYRPYNSLYGGMYYVRNAKHYDNQMRFSMYRWHVMDPIRFESDLKVTIQDLGWYEDMKYKARRDDFYSVAFWYQTLETAPFPKLPTPREMEIS